MLDGPLARAGRPTRLGRDLEGLVDFAFTASALRGARRQRRLGRAAAGAETIRLGTGLAYALLAYFGHAQPPDARLLRAARAIGPVRAAGLTLACGGHRKPGELLLIARIGRQRRHRRESGLGGPGAPRAVADSVGLTLGALDPRPPASLRSETGTCDGARYDPP